MIDSIDYYLKVRKEDIYLICPYFEAFEGMVAIRTPKPTDGPFASIKFMVSPDFKSDFDILIKVLQKKLDIYPLPPACRQAGWERGAS
ncbi:MAG: hypothetical protein QME05_06015, partial [Candidatus Margulisbacteria bacterium]|nr:hypothetical protein [Candidatus Margulisiibacteriota bacterium]